MNRNPEKEAKFLIKRFRKLQGQYIKLMTSKSLENAGRPKYKENFQKLIEVYRKLQELDPRNMLWYGGAIPFREIFLSKKEQMRRFKRRETVLLREVIKILKSGFIKPLL